MKSGLGQSGAKKNSLRVPGLVWLGAAGLGLAGCNSSAIGNFGSPASPPPPVVATPAQPAQDANVIGSGPVKVAFIAPLTQNGQPTTVGLAMRRAVELAIERAGGTDITVLVKDDQSTPQGAQAAAQSAVSEGAELILGPLFGNNVREAGRIARSGGKPLIGFSTDASVASRGVYLLSFLPESDVDRIIDFAAAKGKKSIAGLIPENDYGNIALSAFQTAAARNNMRVMVIERYKSGAAKDAIARIAQLGGQIDSLFIPDSADAMPAISRDLAAANISSPQVQILGTGMWNDQRVMKLPGLQGAWFSTASNQGFVVFVQQYRAKYNSEPPRLATLAYDATNLAIGLARGQGSQRYTEAVLINTEGFTGADGVFRFKAEGINERGLAVLLISKGASSEISPAPRNFKDKPS